jgi:hypothetical protein
LRNALVHANGGDTISFAVTGVIGLASVELLVDKDVIDRRMTTRLARLVKGRGFQCSTPKNVSTLFFENFAARFPEKE